MDAGDIERLKAEQLSAIEKTGERITLLEKYKNDYGELKKRLKTLPDKVTHNVMVPFGKLAFMPGRLIHTNEITVLLGDNWFAEISAKDAIGISERRVADINRQIAELNKQKGLLEPRVNFTSQLQEITQNTGGLVEIKEEYDAENEKAWKAQHAENVRQYRQKMGEGGTCQGEKEEEGEEEVWRRLEELERREMEMDELGRCEESNEGSVQGSVEGSRPRKKSVMWEDEESTSSSMGDSSGEDGDTDGEDNGLGSVIHFSHSKPPVEGNPPDGSSSEDDTTAAIRSPADIYRLYLDTLKPKSILKNPDKSDQQQSSLVTTPAMSPPTTLATTPTSSLIWTEAFTGSVVERDLVDRAAVSSVHQATVSNSAHDDRTPSHTDESPQPTATIRQQTQQQEPGSVSQQAMDTVTQVPPKRVSKFRAQRLQQEVKR